MSKRLHSRPRTEQLEDRLVPVDLNLTGVEWRTIDGTSNNVALPTQGAAETEQIRFGYGDQFPDGIGDAIITAPQRANPRTISNAIHAQSGSVPSDRHLTDWAFQWGQWITHDMDLTRNGPQFNVLSTGAVGRLPHPDRRPERPARAANPIPFNRSEFAAGHRRAAASAATWSTASRRTSTRRWCTAPTRCGRRPCARSRAAS